MAIIDANGIEIWAQQVLRWPVQRKWTSESNMRFRSVFGAGSAVVADVWNRIEADGEISKGAEPKHLLWALVLLKVYQSDEVHCALVGWPSVPTFRKWAWYFIERISKLKDDIIKIENRFEGLGDVVTTNCFMSSDCVDCPCFESWPWTKRMYSKKMNGPGINSFPVTVPLTGQLFGVIFLGGHISLKNRTYRPLLIERACPFKNMCVHT
jgi:hypothetical protein